jgi:hypothetical protein
VLTIPTIISFIHYGVLTTPIITSSIHNMLSFLRIMHLWFVTQQIQTFAIVQINNLFLVRPNTLKTSLINVLFFHHGLQIWQFQYLQYYESSIMESSHFQFALGSQFDQRNVYFNCMICALRINLCPFLYT